MLRSMYSGISGMKNFQTKLDVIGNNIANVNTYGFKKGRVTFKDLVSQQISGASSPQINRGGINPKQVGLGSTTGSIDTIHTQGSLQTTGRALDLALSGEGYFVVNQGAQEFYTRAGNFYVDAEGMLVNSDGMRVQGYGTNAEGMIDKATGLTELEISEDVIKQPITESLTAAGNLNPDNSPVTLDMQFFDDAGVGYPGQVEFTYDETAKQWDYNVTADGTAAGSGTLKFNEDGELNADESNTSSLTANLGGNPVTIDQESIDFSGLTQSDMMASNADVIGDAAALQSYNISAAGEIAAVLSNGDVQLLGQLAVATFNNVGGMEKAGNNLYSASNNSGAPNIGISGDGRGTINAGSLEMSNVDLATEFTEMITAQRGFQANTRIITTSDEILQELVNLKR